MQELRQSQEKYQKGKIFGLVKDNVRLAKVIILKAFNPRVGIRRRWDTRGKASARSRSPVLPSMESDNPTDSRHSHRRETCARSLKLSRWFPLSRFRFTEALKICAKAHLTFFLGDKVSRSDPVDNPGR